MGGVSGYTKLYTPFKGADGDTASIDMSGRGHVLTFQNGAEIDTAQYRYSPSSLLLDRNTSDYVDVPDSADFDMTGDFSLHLAYRLNSAYQDGQVLISKGYFTVGKNGNFLFRVLATTGGYQLITYDGQGNGETVTALDTVNTATWYDIDVIRIGSAPNNVEIFVNGSSIGTGDVDKNLGVNDVDVRIGKDDFGTADYFDGWIGELKLDVGIGHTIDANSVPRQHYSRGDNGIISM